MPLKFSKKLQSEIEVNKKNAVGYIRVSDENQIKGASLETQKIEIRKFCEQNNLNLLKIYSDEGISGKTILKREGFKNMLDQIKPGNFLIVNDITRFGRNQASVTTVFEDLVYRKGCTFISLNPRVDSRNDDCDFMVGLYATLAQRGSKEISMRVKLNMNRLSDEGKLMCRPPFGYKHNPITMLYDRDEEQQNVIDKIRIMYLSGNGPTEIARRLNDEGLGKLLNNNKKTPLPNPKFNPTTIRNILIGYGIDKRNPPEYTTDERVKRRNEYKLSKENNNKKEVSESNNEDDDNIDTTELDNSKEEENITLKKQLEEMTAMIKLLSSKIK